MEVFILSPIRVPELERGNVCVFLVFPRPWEQGNSYDRNIKEILMIAVDFHN